MGKKKKKRRRSTPKPDRPTLQIRTTIDFGEEGVPLEQLGDVRDLLEAHQLDFESAAMGFVPISFDRYVRLHLRSNPSVDREEYVVRLRKAVDARKAGARCACGAFIWAIGSAEVGRACFTCITGESLARQRL